MLYYRTTMQDKIRHLSAQNAANVSLTNGLLPPVTGNVIGVALNNKALMASLETAFNEKPHVQPPKTPVLHIKTNNTHIGYGHTIQVPKGKGAIYAGPSLGIVIGKKATRVEAANALDFIQGFTVVNEVSLAETSFYRPAVKAKCRDTFCPIGPWVADKSLIAHPNSLGIKTLINGSLVHETNTDQLIYSVEEIVSYISSFMTLEEGDVIIAGTPQRTAELEIRPGDSVTIDIETIGSLTNPVEQE
ncbi:fumarylacetoacetate hydrolase family protein [Marinomonas sp. IMCC 4694]|uniref:fumarylacetoacetate hydrolase family protein n=1 Tax=Marinomonas sp. IMCC 4694 TaxID=2605432 RepID=UPI0011E6BCB2|nr:fumarylacetoacetate hydrolase family protein [Marinomonas sp. IMCC 4694]TYL47688.1 4-hydroxyphenylacetate isomerase [Marinomonas sp. IMCC 4694]